MWATSLSNIFEGPRNLQLDICWCTGQTVKFETTEISLFCIFPSKLHAAWQSITISSTSLAIVCPSLDSTGGSVCTLLFSRALHRSNRHNTSWSFSAGLRGYYYHFIFLMIWVSKLCSSSQILRYSKVKNCLCLSWQCHPLEEGFSLLPFNIGHLPTNYDVKVWHQDSATL